MQRDRVAARPTPVSRGRLRRAATGGLGHGRPVLAREYGGPWSARPGGQGDGSDPAGETDGQGDGSDPAGETDGRLAALAGAVEAVVEADLDPLTDEQVKQQLRVVQRQIDRLTAHRARCAGLLERRAIRQSGSGRTSRAVRDSQQFLREDLRLTPSEAKQTGRTGRELASSPRTERAHRDGDLREPHARVITEVLRHLTGEQRTHVEQRLLAAARTATPTELRALADRLLARADEHEAERVAARRHDRRHLRMTRGADGLLHIRGAVSGIDAELAQTAVDAFRVPDAERERRSPEQASADAFVAAMRAALDAAEAPNRRGVPPHVIVVARAGGRPAPAGDGSSTDAGTPASGGAPQRDPVVDITAADGLWSGPLPASEVRRLCRDAVISRVVLDHRTVPIEASRAHRAPGSGLWRALLVRDRGCRWPGCDAPPVWCDVAHGLVPDRDGGRLSPANAVLLCRRHHRKVDDGWRIDIDGAHVTFTSSVRGHRVESPPPTPLPGEEVDMPPPTLWPEEGDLQPPARPREDEGGDPGEGPSRAPPGG